jgi:hypothetical protein
LAEAFNLRSSSIVFNQYSIGAQYLSFRYVPPSQPPRYFDAAIGVDQAEAVFTNPATVAELKREFLKIWTPVVEKSKAKIVEHYFEATLHGGTGSVGAKAFIDRFVKVDTPQGAGIDRGFSLTSKHHNTLEEARLGLEVSGVVADGLHVSFACLSRTIVEDVVNLQKVMDAALKTFKDLSSLAQVEVEIGEGEQ